MTTYERELSSQLQSRFSKLTPAEMFEKLIQIGVVDFTLCKVLAVREYVEKMVKQGTKKVDAMWCASEHFACSYEYIRKCMYYYKNVNMR